MDQKERIKLMDEAAIHFAAVLKCKLFIATGSYALYKYGLVDKVSDLDIRIVDITPEAREILVNLQNAEASIGLKFKGQEEYVTPLGGLFRIMYNGFKIDFFTDISNPDFEHYITLQNGVNISTVPSIIFAKKSCNRLKDWLQLRNMAQRIFMQSDLNTFINDQSTKY